LLVEQHFPKNLSKLTGPWSCKVKRIVFRQHVAPVCFCISSNTSHAAGFAFGSYGWMFMQSYRRISSPGIEPSSLRCRGRNATSVAKLGHHEFKLSYLSPSWTFSEHKLWCAIMRPHRVVVSPSWAENESDIAPTGLSCCIESILGKLSRGTCGLVAMTSA